MRQRVAMLQSIVTDEGAHAVGDLVTVDERTAIEWLSLGFAERADGVVAPESCVKSISSRATKPGAKR